MRCLFWLALLERSFICQQGLWIPWWVVNQEKQGASVNAFLACWSGNRLVGMSTVIKLKLPMNKQVMQVGSIVKFWTVRLDLCKRSDCVQKELLSCVQIFWFLKSVFMTKLFGTSHGRYLETIYLTRCYFFEQSTTGCDSIFHGIQFSCLSVDNIFLTRLKEVIDALLTKYVHNTFGPQIKI